MLQEIDTPPPVLEGRFVRLEPLNLTHALGLFDIGQDERIWQYFLTSPFVTLDDAIVWVQNALQRSETELERPFAVVERQSGRVVGSSRFRLARLKDRVVELGGTWFGTEWWRTPMNTETRLLMMTEAFERWNAIRVQIWAALANVRSQRAIERLGAVREGVLRRYQDGNSQEMSDVVLYSIIDDEWPIVKERLQGFLMPRPAPSISTVIDLSIL
jgi:N-acetyltransferase